MTGSGLVLIDVVPFTIIHAMLLIPENMFDHVDCTDIDKGSYLKSFLFKRTQSRIYKVFLLHSESKSLSQQTKAKD